MSHHHESSSHLGSFISLFIEIISALGLSLVTLIIAVPLLGFIIYLGCALLFPAAWAFPITAAFMVCLLLFTALFAWYDA